MTARTVLSLEPQARMTDATLPPANPAPMSDARVAFYNDPKIRGLFFQALAIVILVWLVWGAYSNASTEMAGRALSPASGSGAGNLACRSDSR